MRPILSDACFHCHGRDPSHREADLRIDQWEPTAGARGAESVVVPGDPDHSELIARVAAHNGGSQMPPASSGKKLTHEQIGVLRAWVAAGGKYEKHWSFVAPRRRAVPRVGDSGWVKNPIDAFVLSRLEEEGISPSPQADAAALLRRLSIDLIGLPPQNDVIAPRDAMDDPGRYDRSVEELLASPHFGERWGRLWLDAARYADSNGFEKDHPREVWLYRDWVIDALNHDLPYDQFIIQQVAGDLLPERSREDLIATGFLRNSMVNEEGGIDPEQFRMEGLFDRVDAIGKSILGLTVQCAQCHTHKYDPISHAEYYGMLALLNDSYEAQATFYPAKQQQQRRAVLGQIRQIEQGLKDQDPDWRRRVAEWESTLSRPDHRWQVVRPELDGSGGQKHYLQPDGSVLAEGYAPTQTTTEFTIVTELPRIAAVRLELLNHPTLPHGGPGRSSHGTCALTEFQVSAATQGDSETPTPWEIARATADINPPRRSLGAEFDDSDLGSRFTGPVDYAIDGDESTAWSIDIGPGRSNTPRQAVFTLAKPIELPGPTRITFKLVQKHGQSYHTDIYTNNLGRFRFSLSADPNAAADPIPAAVGVLLAKKPDERSAAETDQVFSYWRAAAPHWSEANAAIEEQWRSHPSGTSQLVLKRLETPRETHRLDRGDWLKPAERVSGGVPEFLHKLNAQQPDRLDFARWLADRSSPTTARVIVNRIWQAYFGRGLVETAEDFGVQGAPPTHPELLDWLAVELMDSGWSLKHIHRLIVQSATYRQSSVVSASLLHKDPQNLLLARGARYRVDAEVVRDLALSASGLLERKVGGPGVYPPAPDYLFKPPASYAPKRWDYDLGRDKYRRAVYTFRYRSTPYPVFQTFDAPSGEVACVRRGRSNTPLQALALLNEELFFECAQELSALTIKNAGADPKDRIEFLFDRCLSRRPSANELDVLQKFVATQRSRLESGEIDAGALVGGSKAVDTEARQSSSHRLATQDLAAWTVAARVVLSLDEAISRE
ncbi:PSD1 and planctomycete cytochrome C domain-containing protein [Pirellulimonas nuda]|uniref:PSD1 and planctomycete cytochrome C domain-containing protein n=1 Tax=Pirellulimonas nuda TaxID=2528009 RepID=UPI001E466DB4|nr:PSD1 and planctomycete cytochrome C domain-containing protein [Pirellulimonas nuda]